MANAAWNGADLLNVTLSNSNLTATATLGGAWVRANGSASTGKYYIEGTLNSLWNGNSGFGFAPKATNPPAGALSSGVTAVSGFGGCYVNGTSFANLGTLASGTIVGIAIDVAARLIWYRVAPAGNWNGSVTADPATGSGGINISALAGNLYPIYTDYASPDPLTINFGDSSFSGVVPSGYTAGFPAGFATNVISNSALVREALITTIPNSQLSGIVREVLLASNTTMELSGLVREVLLASGAPIVGYQNAVSMNVS